MTQEQKIARGTIVIFILSIVLLICLCTTATLAYFAGSQQNNTTLILGGPVRVTLEDNTYQETIGANNLVMNIRSDRDTLLPGMGIDMQAIALVSSSTINPTRALLRAVLDIDVQGLDSAVATKEVEKQIRDAMSECFGFRIDGIRSGWVYFDDGNYYYCAKDKVYDSNTQQEYIEMQPINPGDNVSFINGTFQFPYKYYTNKYSNIEITFTLSFEAIQEVLVNDDGDRIPNTIFNMKNVIDSVDWSTHNN